MLNRLLASNPEMQNSLEEFMHRPLFILGQGQLLGLIFLIIASVIISKITRKFATRLIKTSFERANIKIEDVFIKKMSYPIRLLAFFILWPIVLQLLDFPEKIERVLIHIGHLGLGVGTMLTLSFAVDLVGEFYEKRSLPDFERHDPDGLFPLLAPLIRKTLKFFVWGLGAILIGNSLGLDMKGPLAGLGIGGLAFALAAKDTLSNLFGSFTVLMDRPFKIKDWVKIGDNIEGEVEEVGLRSTRIRTIENTLITVPNGHLTNIHINNFGKRKYRVYRTTLNLSSENSSEKIQQFCRNIKAVILENKFIEQDNYQVVFNNIQAYALEILVHTSFQVMTLKEELREKENLNHKIISIAQELSIKWATPYPHKG